MRKALFFVLFAAGGVLAAWQTSTSKATQAGQTTPKNAQDDQSGTTGSNAGLPAAKAGDTNASGAGTAAKKHRKHRGRHKPAAN